jgi:hypothetical protein
MTTLTGGCHCGKVRFRVRVDTFEAVECNCSICTKKGFLHLMVEASAFELLAGKDDLVTYTFNTHVAKHHFCGTCGMHPFYVPRSHPNGFDVNVRCLDDDAMNRFTVSSFDGKHWEDNIEALREQVPAGA